MLSLIVLEGPDKGRVFRLSGEHPTAIGRQTGDLRLMDRQVSRKHAEINLENGTWVLRDLGSSNGTLVNGERVVGLMELEEGDQIQFGQIVLMVGLLGDGGVGLDETRVVDAEEMDHVVLSPQIHAVDQPPDEEVDLLSVESIEHAHRPDEPMDEPAKEESPASIFDQEEPVPTPSSEASIEDELLEESPSLTDEKPLPIEQLLADLEEELEVEASPEPATKSGSTMAEVPMDILASLDDEVEEMSAFERAGLKKEVEEEAVADDDFVADETPANLIDSTYTNPFAVFDDESPAAGPTESQDDESVVEQVLDEVEEGDAPVEVKPEPEIEPEPEAIVEPVAGTLPAEIIDEDEICEGESVEAGELREDAADLFEVEASSDHDLNEPKASVELDPPPPPPEAPKAPKAPEAPEAPPEPSDDSLEGQESAEEALGEEPEVSTELLEDPVQDEVEDMPIVPIAASASATDALNEDEGKIEGDEVEKAEPPQLPVVNGGGVPGVFPGVPGVPPRPLREPAKSRLIWPISIAILLLIAAGSGIGGWWTLAGHGKPSLEVPSSPASAFATERSQVTLPEEIVEPPIIESALEQASLAMASPLEDGPRLLGRSVLADRVGQEPMPVVEKEARVPVEGVVKLPPALPPASVEVQTPEVASAVAIETPAELSPSVVVEASVEIPAPAPVIETLDVNRVVYLVDASGSLVDTWPIVLNWLDRHLRQLDTELSYTIVFFRAGEAIEVPPIGMKDASDESLKRQVRRWFDWEQDNVFPAGRSDPREALDLALNYQAGQVFILSDGHVADRLTDEQLADYLIALDDQVADATLQIHCVQFFYPKIEGLLAHLVRRYPGQQVFIGSDRPKETRAVVPLDELTASP